MHRQACQDSHIPAWAQGGRCEGCRQSELDSIKGQTLLQNCSAELHHLFHAVENRSEDFQFPMPSLLPIVSCLVFEVSWRSDKPDLGPLLYTKVKAKSCQNFNDSICLMLLERAYVWASTQIFIEILHPFQLKLSGNLWDVCTCQR